jgi:hypothetical protein
VERREWDEPLELRHDLVVDHNGPAEPLSAVDDPVPDRVGIHEPVDDLGRVVLRDDAELQRLGPRVDDEHPGHRVTFPKQVSDTRTWPSV